MAALTGLLARDATFEMPPTVTWFAGRDDITRFLAARVLTEPGQVPADPGGRQRAARVRRLPAR